MKKAISYLLPHLVYTSLYTSLKYANLKIYPATDFLHFPTKRIVLTSAFFIQFSNCKDMLSKFDLFIMDTPILEMASWFLLRNKFPTIFVEEYYKKNIIKDLLARCLLRPFIKFYPFVSLTKRTDLFLRSIGATSFFIPPAEKKYKGSNSREFILFVSKMIETKNPFFILKLADKFPNEHFVMIGQGPLLPKVKDLSRNMRNVEVIDFIPEREHLFKHYYSKAKMLLHTAYKDPVGFVVVEALSTQTPVLCSSGVGASDFLPKKWVLHDYDESKWCQSIENILNEPASKEAEMVFKKENLDLSSPYFKKIGREIAGYIKT